MTVLLLNLLAGFIGLIHVYIFYLESIAWGKPPTNKAFGQTSADAEKTRLFAYNQGFYNLFLAIAIFIGLGMNESGRLPQGRTLIDYAVASVFGAGLVLFTSARELRKAAIMQAGPAAIYLALRFIFL